MGKIYNALEKFINSEGINRWSFLPAQHNHHDEMAGTSDTPAGLDAVRKDGSRARLNPLPLKSNQYIGFFFIALLGLVISGGVGYYFGVNSKRKAVTPHLVTATDQSSRQSAENNILNHAEQGISSQAFSQNPPQPAETRKADAVPEIETPKDDHKIPVQAEEQKPLYSEEKIIGFLNNWIGAWKNTAGKQGDMNAYMACYSNYFNAENFTKDGWQEDKFIKNSAKKWIDVKLEDVTIKEASRADSVEVGFLQTYQSSNYVDTSNKILILKKEKTGWKIISER
ncbi:MAG: hypothetical protein U9N60_01615 [Thermodesulfobacteriota bacterium]|nr:hypothetical protein [Thermodesulfobacteriota bacterium]